MEDKIIFCPTCGQGTLDSEEIEESSSNRHIQTFCYSCGHKREIINDSVTTRAKAELTKIVSRSGNKKAGKHQEYEIEERYRENDRDHPGKPTRESVFINHKDKSVFHVVKYRDAD